MTGALARLPGWRVLSIALLGGLTVASVVAAGGFRTPQWFFAPTLLAGAVLVVLTALVLARRIAIAAPSGGAHDVLEVAVRYAPLGVLNLMVLSVVAPVLGLIASAMRPVSVWRVWLGLLGLLSAWALFCLFAVGVVGLVAVLAMRFLDRVLRALGISARGPALVDRAIVGATAAYCLWAALLACNGALDRGPASEHRGEIVAVWGIPGTFLWWADLRPGNGSPGGIERVLIVPARDGLSPAMLDPRQRVRVVTRPGRFGITWVQAIGVDFGPDLEALVAAAPTAGRPRRDLIARLIHEGRFADAARHTATYARHHPADRAFVAEVEETLRGPVRPAAARAPVAPSASAFRVR